MSKHERFENMFPRDGGRQDEPLDDPMDNLVGDEGGQVDDYEAAEQDAEQDAGGFRLRREIKLGLALIGVLALVLVSTLLWRTFRGTGESIATTDEEKTSAASANDSTPRESTTAPPAASRKPAPATSVQSKTRTANNSRDDSTSPGSSDDADAGENRRFRADAGAGKSTAPGSDRFAGLRADAEKNGGPLAPDPAPGISARSPGPSASDPFLRPKSLGEDSQAGPRTSPTGRVADAEPPSTDAGTVGIPRVSAAADASTRSANDVANPLRGVAGGDIAPRATEDISSRSPLPARPETPGLGGRPANSAASDAASPTMRDGTAPGAAAGIARAADSRNSPRFDADPDPTLANQRQSLPASEGNTLSRSARLAAAAEPDVPTAAKSNAKSNAEDAADADGAGRRGNSLFGASSTDNSGTSSVAAGNPVADPRRFAAESGAAASGATALGATGLGATGLGATGLGAAASPARSAFARSDAPGTPASAAPTTIPGNTASARDGGFSPLGTRGGLGARGAFERSPDAGADAGTGSGTGADTRFGAAVSPPKSTASSAPREAVEPSPTPRRTAADNRVYVVQEGDSLMDIARYELGQAVRWTEIYELNRDRVGDRPHEPPTGTQLILPGETGGAGNFSQRPGTSFDR